MPRKSAKSNKSIENAAWEWINSVTTQQINQQNVETAYRLHFKPCKQCRRNCRNNPTCLTGIGEREWYEDDLTVPGQDIVDPTCETRDKGSHVGLTNLGNTCYVNSFLQLWFHNLHVRRAIFLWEAEENVQKKLVNNSDPAHDEGYQKDLYEPKSIIGHLQLLFALLQRSERKFLDPGPLIKFLELDTSEQQDAHEFNNLFLSLVQSQLSSQSSPEVQNVIGKQYSGSYNYVTKCQSCGTSSFRTSNFYELDLHIKGHKELSECIMEFLKEENLEGSDQYFCDKCNLKRNATRYISLKHLPPVLNLQLLRFVFDRQSGRKKKLNLFLKFPEVLDMSAYLPSNEPIIYKLSAVLMHVSSSADSGHYYSYILDQTTMQWFRYNDQTVEKLDKLKLDTEEEISDEFETGSTKKPKVSKGQHASNSVYMLVYYKDSSDVRITEGDLVIPENVKDVVKHDNQIFTERICELEKMKSENLEKHKLKQTEVRSIYEKLKVNDLKEPFEFLPVDWLTKWLSSKSVLPEINNNQFLCRHSKLSLDDIHSVKCVSSETAEKLYAMYGGGPRLRDALCYKCVKQRCELMQIESQSLKDKKVICQLLKNNSTDTSLHSKLFWIGKSSLRSWRKILLSNYDIPNHSSAEMDIDANDSLHSFNEDLHCIHDSLSIESERRRLVPEEVWNIFRGYFPNCPQYSSNTETCRLCAAEEEEDKLLKEKQIVLATEIKSQLFDLCHDKNRPKWSVPDVNSIYIISEEFVHSLRQFIRDPKKYEAVECIGNKLLLCKHDKLSYPPYCTKATNHNCPLVFVSSVEWDILKVKFQIDMEILAKKIPQDQCDGSEIWSDPPFCDECYMKEKTTALEQEVNFTAAVIYIRKVLKSENYDFQSEKSANESSIDLNDRPNFFPKKPKLMIDIGLKKTAADLSSTRRSHRSRKQRGDKEIKVSASQTLKELKQQITKMFGILMSDQNLTLDGQELTPSHATLASLNVTPSCIILLTVDDIYRDDCVISVPTAAPVPEVGFKGTKLMER